MNNFYGTKRWLLVVSLILFLPMLAAAEQASRHHIRDDAPAADWETGHPVGNGRLGATAFGRFPKERILLNEETIWARGPQGVMADDRYH